MDQVTPGANRAGEARLDPQAAAVCLLYRVFWYATAVVGACYALARDQ